MKLVLIGGCRNAEDEKRVRDLKDLCGHMSVEDNVEFKVLLPPQPRFASSVSSRSFFPLTSDFYSACRPTFRLRSLRLK